MNKSIWKKNIYTKRSKRIFLSRFLYQLSVLMSSGIDLNESLTILNEQFSGGFEQEIEALRFKIQKGFLLSQSMDENSLYPVMLQGVIAAGESTGKLTEVLESMSKHYEKEFSLREKLKNSLIYPVTLGVTLLIVITFLITFVLPTFVDLFQQANELLPLATRLLLQFSSWVSRIGKYLFAILIVFYLLYRLFTFRGKGKYVRDRILFYLPSGGLRKEYYLSHIASTLALLLENGVEILSSLEILILGIPNLYLKDLMTKVSIEIERGKEVSEAFFETQFFPKAFCSMLRVGEESGTLATMFQGAGKFYENELMRKLDRVVKMTEPIMILILAFVVGYVVLAITVPMFDLIHIVSQ